MNIITMCEIYTIIVLYDIQCYKGVFCWNNVIAKPPQVAQWRLTKKIISRTQTLEILDHLIDLR